MINCKTCRSSFANMQSSSRSFDGKAKVWSVETRQCVATHSESDKALWAAKWLPKTGRNESFVTAGADGNISFYREASGSS